MNKQDHIKYWLTTAEHDLEVAESLFNAGKYDYCLFIGHLIIEKIVKAIWVRDNIENIPPKVHDLIYLSNRTQLNLSEEIKERLRLINRFNLEVRYPDYKHSFYRECNKLYAEENFLEIKELYKWLLTKL